MPIPALILLLAGCTQEAPEDKIVVVTGGGHSSAGAEDFEKHRFPCCDHDAVTETIGAYIDLSDALASDAEDRAKAAGAALAARAKQASEAVENMDHDGIKRRSSTSARSPTTTLSRSPRT